jgi:uncharacterized protein (TIGR00304 family)
MMRARSVLGVALVVSGAALTVLGVATGEVQVGLLLFFIPYLYGSSWMGGLAILLVFAGLVVLILGRFAASNQEAGGAAQPTDPGMTKRKWEFGGVVLIGPVPIVFGSSDRAALWALMIAAAVVMLLLLALLWL